MRCIVMRRMATDNVRRARPYLFCALALVALAGCQENEQTFGPVTATPAQQPELNLSADRGVPVPPAGPVDPRLIAANVGSRQDPWSLLSEEWTFEQSERTERFLGEVGGFRVDVAIEEDVETEEAPPVIEPVPQWRLAGVIIGQGVIGLLDTGRNTYEIRPGMTVPGTEWYVVSIDQEKAVLRRDGNKLPREFAVGLSGPIGDGMGGGGGAAGGGNPRGGGDPLAGNPGATGAAGGG
jgi:hypothetical protein